MKTFKELNLSEPLMLAIEQIGYTKPTPIQSQAILPAMQGKDIFGCAQTGTGKTAAFSLPILEKLIKSGSNGKIKALIMVPTRELALQVYDNIIAYSVRTELKATVIFGGVSQLHQEVSLKRNVDILVATPGRLLDLMSQGIIKLNDIEYFVLDEADKMLDMGFIHDIRKVISKLPAKKQTLFFSATVSNEIRQLASTLLHQPLHISVDPVSSVTPKVEQQVFYVSKENKRYLLKHLLSGDDVEHALVFTRTKRRADRVAKELNKSGIASEALHGDKSQGARQRALNNFKDRKLRVLVATDIASRGIDVDKLSHVINYEIPEDPETYVHRIGRTGRAGMQGKAFSLCGEEELSYFNDIKKFVQQKIHVNQKHPFVQ